jgi:ClpP class serine protease
MIMQVSTSSLWAIHPGWLDRITAALDPSNLPLEAAARDRAPSGPAVQRDGGIAILPLTGVLSPNPDPFERFFGATDTIAWGRAFSGLVADPDVSIIVVPVNSPGGDYCNTPEVSDLVFSARQKKQVIVVVSGMMASAAFWIGSSAGEVYASPSTEVGSVGVLALHRDYSLANAQQGVTPTLVTSSRFKGERSPDFPLGAEAKSELQRRVDQAGQEFHLALARNRNTSPATVATKYGEGRMMPTKSALQIGMIDGVCSVDDLINDLVSTRNERRARISAERQKFAAMARQLAYESTVEIELAAMQPTPKARATARRMTKAEIRAELAALRAKYPELRRPFVRDYR